MPSESFPHRLITCLPESDLDDYVSAVEVLVQEGLTSFALPAGVGATREVLQIFGSRATFGVYRVRSAEQVSAAAELGMPFVFSDLPDAEIAQAANEAEMANFASAMTPTEARRVLELGFSGVLVYPADVTGHAMAARLAEQGLIEQSIPLGGIGAYAAGEWIDAGALAVCVDSALLGDAFQGGSLGQLRDRCSSFTAIQARMAAQGSQS